MAVDSGDVVLFRQVLHQLNQRKALERGAGVGRAAVGIEAADIGDADTVGVVALGVCARLLHRTASVDAAIGIDDVMIADVAPAEGTMVAANALHGADGVGTRSGAMDDDFGDCSHGANGFSGFNGLNGRNKGKQADCPRCGRLAWLGIRRR